jgi:hypothetical protein
VVAAVRDPVLNRAGKKWLSFSDEWVVEKLVDRVF